MSRSHLVTAALLVAFACRTPEASPPPEPAAAPLARPAALPDALAVNAFSPPAPETRTLSNGVQVLIAPDHRVPTWSLRVVFRAGGAQDLPGKEGTAGAALDLMDEGAGGLTSAQLSHATKLLGSSLSTAAGGDSAVIAASGLTRNLDATLDLWAKVLLTPDFPASEWQIVQSRRVQDAELQRATPASVAGRVSQRLFWGDAYIGRASTPATIRGLTVEDLRAWRNTWLGPENAVILVGGDVTADQVVAALEARLATWKPAGVTPVPTTAPAPAPQKSAIYLVNMPGGTQSVVRSGIVTVGRSDPAYFDLLVANQALGGSFSGRINLNLREDKGYTYGARCGLSSRLGPSTWSCNAGVRADATGASLTELRKEMAQVRAERPLTPDELQQFRDGLVREFPQGFETAEDRLGLLQDVWAYGLGPDWIPHWTERVSAVDAPRANAALAAHLDPATGWWLIVGDLAKVRPQLDGIDLPIVELDLDGNPVRAK